MNKFSVAAAIAAFVCSAAAAAQERHDREFMPAPPGSVVERQLVAFNGEGIANRWAALASKRLVGSGNGRDFYQWYLSIYALRRGAYRLTYESPGNGGPLSRVTQANGAKMWFPVAEVHIVGVAKLMRHGVEQLVVASHEAAADCGSATVTIFASKPGGTVGAEATISNPCQLGVKIGDHGRSLDVTGPYYAGDAPLCCPSKPNAAATLRYRDGEWIESPNYFKLARGGD